MILADTSVWVAHFRAPNRRLQQFLESGLVTTHPFVIGELACGNLYRRKLTLQWLRALPVALVADHDEVLRLLDERNLRGKGIGWVDMHLLASAALSGNRLWTLDTRLNDVAEALDLAL